MSDQDRNLVLGQLKELGDLKENGILSESEFQIEKEKLLVLLNNINSDFPSSNQGALKADEAATIHEEPLGLELSKDSSKAKSIAKGYVRTVGAVYTLGMSEVVIRSRKKRKASEADLDDLKVKDESNPNQPDAKS